MIETDEELRKTFKNFIADFKHFKNWKELNQMIRKQSPRQKIRNRARYWDSDYLAGFVKGLKIRQEYEYRRGMRDLHKKISERYGLDDEQK